MKKIKIILKKFRENFIMSIMFSKFSSFCSYLLDGYFCKIINMIHTGYTNVDLEPFLIGMLFTVQNKSLMKLI